MSSIFQVLVHTCTQFGHPPHPSLSIWVIPSLYGPSPSSICQFSSNNFNFSSISSIFRVFAHVCTHFGYHHPPGAAITPHNRLAYPPSTSWPSAITHPSIFEQQSQPFLKSINISIFHTCACPIWSPPPTCIAQCLWAINPSSLPPFPGVLATTTTLWWPSLPILC